ncbi:carbohydrate ABC transporter permease [Paenibacillus cremeus]|uniref:Sugar ABC transporter permease n=1 Tax=Paenibacillus cremeus TaxID=2163881 RepID=A0A559K5X7_9BACL|nr:sugar ABC transporter permease [Paenibacillus cremeus]TVY07503.1 sugar ABC transporter permease [Paenibacillus cremeus]
MSSISNKRAPNSLALWDKLVPYVFIAPFIISFVIFFVFPSVYSFVLSFFRYRGYGSATFVGLDNYIALFIYPTFWTAVYNTLFYWIVHIIPVMAISFLLAVAVNSKLVKWKGFFKPVIFLPQITAAVASALIFKVIFATRYGVINKLLGTQIFFLEDPLLMKWSVVALILWRAIGWYFVIYMAGLTTISDEIQEAATIDGANAAQRLWHITVPLMRPIFLFAFMMDTIGSLKIYSEPLLMFSTGMDAPTDVIPILSILTRNINGGNFGLASAVGWVLFVMILLVSLIQYKALRGGNDE